MNTSTHNTISHVIARQLREDILRERYRADERLPSERELAARFDASRGAVREALSQLEQVGLIRILPGGARVQAIDSASIQILGSLMSLDELPDPALVDQFLQVFGALVAINTRGAVAKATDEQIQQLQEMVARLQRNAADFDVMQRSWRELAERLSSIDDNLVVKLIGNDLRAQFVERMTTLDIKPHIAPGATTELVRRLQDSLANRDAPAAAAAMQDHFDQLRQAVVAVIATLHGNFERKAV